MTHVARCFLRLRAKRFDWFLLKMQSTMAIISSPRVASIPSHYRPWRGRLPHLHYSFRTPCVIDCCCLSRQCATICIRAASSFPRTPDTSDCGVYTLLRASRYVSVIIFHLQLFLVRHGIWLWEYTLRHLIISSRQCTQRWVDPASCRCNWVQSVWSVIILSALASWYSGLFASLSLIVSHIYIVGRAKILFC